MSLTFEEAAHRLRMTVSLLRWCTRYSPKRDGRKLRLDASGGITEDELAAFDAYLREPWPTKNPGLEIQREIDRESRGRCGHCLENCDTVEGAHIDRYEVELSYHCNHPHNLINLCPTCHTRYDGPKTISNDTIKHAKRQLLTQLLADVDMGRQMQDFVRDRMAAMVAERVQAHLSSGAFLLTFAQQVTGHVETMLTGSVTTPPASSGEAGTRLAQLSGSVSEQRPLTALFVASLSSSFDQGALPATDVDIEDLYVSQRTPGKCDQCGCETPIDHASCSECETDAGFHDHASPCGNGLYELSDEDVRGDFVPFECKCGSGTFEVEFQRTCSACEHFIDRANDA